MNVKQKRFFRLYRQLDQAVHRLHYNLHHKLPYKLFVLAIIVAFILASANNPLSVSAAGPGLGNLTYTSGELNTRISIINDSNPSGVTSAGDGHGNVTMHDGYLVTIYTSDGGGQNAGFAFWNVSNPRSPSRVANHRPSNSKLREPHGFGFTTGFGRSYFIGQSTQGFQIWDWTDINAPTLVRDVVLSGVNSSDYGGSWWISVQAPYVYVAGGDAGLYVVDISTPTSPVVRKTMTNAQVGVSRLNQVLAVGNLLIGGRVEGGTGISLMDISDPINPVVKFTTTSLATPYSSIFNNGKLYVAAKAPSNSLFVYNVNFDANNMPSGISQFGSATGSSLDGGGYLSYQDGFIMAGFSNSYAKFDVRTSSMSQVARVDPNVDGAEDIDFGVVLGNIVFAGNDHGNGTGLIVHQTAPDTTGPIVNFVSPRNNAVNQNVKSRIGVTFSDGIDIRTLNTTNFIVRPVGGAAIAGKFSVSNNNMVNFAPDSALLANTIYEVVVPAGGVRDFVGNSVPTQFSSRFSTGSTLDSGPANCNIGTDTPGNVGATISFNATGCTGTGLNYSWNFGDGSAATAFSTSSTASRVYSSPNHYNVILTVRDSANRTATFNRRQTIIHPVTASKPTNSSTIVYDSGRSRVSVVNSDAGTVASLSSVSPFTKQWEVSVGRNPQTLAVNAPNGDIWVAVQGDARIKVLNGGTGAEIATINLPYGSRPFGIAFNPVGTLAYVSLEGTGRLLKIDRATRAIVGTVDVGPKPRGVAVSADGNRVFVTRFISPSTQGEVREVNASTFAVTRTFSLRKDTTTPSSEGNGPGLPNYVQSVVITPSGKQAWVPSKKDNISRGTGPTSDGTALTFDSTVRTIVSKLDVAGDDGTISEEFNIRQDINNADMANAVVFNNLGDYAFVSTQGNNHIEVIDALTHTSIAAIENVGRAPRGLVLVGNLLFVQNFMSRDIAVYNVSTVGGTNQFAKQGGNVSTQAVEPLSAQVLQGKRIFYNAGDPKMSREAYISCASCHLDGDSDGQTWDFTQRGEGVRNTTALIGRGGVAQQGPVHWTGNFDEIQDFENDIRGGFGGLGFMSDTDFNNTSNPLGAPKAGRSAELDALAAYVASLTTVNPSPFRNSNGSMTADALAGKTLFESSALGCAGCHSGGFKTDSAVNLLHNVGTITSASGRRLNGTLTGFDTPSLLGIWETAPYLHDGSAATLMDVITTKNPSNQHGNTTQLTATERNQLVAYLQQLDSSDGPAIPPTNTPQPPTNTPVASGLITNVSARDTANAADWSRQVNLQVGNLTYTDRTITFTSIPASVAGSEWIRPANDSKSYTGNPLVTFDLTQSATVYVGWCDCQARPSWLDTTWTDTGENLVTSAGIAAERNLSLYRKNFAAGQVALGPYTFSTGYVYVTIAKVGGTPTATPTRTNTPSVPTNTPSGSVSITNLSAKDTTNAADWSIQANLRTGINVYGDRAFTFATVPTEINGAAWIRTANDSKTSTVNPQVTFNISQTANVYVIWDNRSVRPAWFDATWIDTGSDVTISGDGSNPTYSVYRKQFAAGQVSLGPNGSTGGGSMYSIAVK